MSPSLSEIDDRERVFATQIIPPISLHGDVAKHPPHAPWLFNGARLTESAHCNRCLRFYAATEIVKSDL